MRRLCLSLVLLTMTAALAGGIVHLVEVDGHGELRFEPRLDTTALSWWQARAIRALESLPGLEVRVADSRR